MKYFYDRRSLRFSFRFRKDRCEVWPFTICMGKYRNLILISSLFVTNPPPYPSCFPLRWYSVCAGNRWIAFGNSCEVKLPVENMRWDCVQCGAVVSHALIKLLADFVPTWRVTFPSQPAAFSRFKPTFHSGISNIHFLSWDFWSEKKKVW